MKNIHPCFNVWMFVLQGTGVLCPSLQHVAGLRQTKGHHFINKDKSSMCNRCNFQFELLKIVP